MSRNYRQDQDSVAEMQRDLKGSIFNDQQRALQRSTENRENAKELLKQIEEHKHAADMERRATCREGEEIQRQARLYEVEMNKLSHLKNEEKRELMKSHLAHIADRDLLRVIEKKMEEDDDDLIKDYVVAKQKMAILRREKEEELYRKAMDCSDKMTELLAEQMKQKFNDEEERLTKALEEIEAKLKKESMDKEEKRKADVQGITDHRMAMRKRKEEEETDGRLQGLQDRRDTREADDFFFAQQRDQRKRAQDECKNVQAIQIQQMRKKKEDDVKEQRLQGLQDRYDTREADDFFFAKQREQKKKAQDECRNIQAIQIQQMAEKKAMAQAQRAADIEYDKQKNEEMCQEYAKHVIDSDRKAAQKGNGGKCGYWSHN
ncbi:cilia- and flagella- associated protein 210-like [Dendropsophus ebraccatus]|uniref:cilia- and flagella- associated protein 210-like n=1 Tax=Dendropsophus ebraccatus TaxID=150705 RepID=UPI0038322508